jgi:hypothetical protein
MLTSNWDDKDARNVELGSNTAIQEYRQSNGIVQYRYLITDWGGTFGKVGLPGIVRNKWDCAGYTEQTAEFVRGMQEDGTIEWGYVGTNSEVRQGITRGDVRWLLRYLGRISDRQLDAALRASGATQKETHCFRSAVRRRIEALKEVSDRQERARVAVRPGITVHASIGSASDASFRNANVSASSGRNPFLAAAERVTRSRIRPILPCS